MKTAVSVVIAGALIGGTILFSGSSGGKAVVASVANVSVADGKQIIEISAKGGYAPTLTAGTLINPTTCAGTNGSIAFTTTNLANGTYTLNYSKGGVATTRMITVTANAFTLMGLTAVLQTVLLFCRYCRRLQIF